ncbi:MAG TPA: type II secretion system F family protein [Gemmatimonadales bacterium]|jgi:general secretion pathway protein F|nr:type II secretion system F family protein [Gemmatimonadales bacterium]
MKRFRYRAACADGRIASGMIVADSAARVDDALAARGLLAIRVTPLERQRFRAVPRSDLAVAFRCLASLVQAGVSLTRALAATEALVRPGRLKAALTEAGRLLREGRPLCQALAGYPGLIPEVVLGMIQAGERASRLTDALEQVAAQLARDAEIAAQIRQAVAYPAVLLATGTVSVLLIGTVVLPRFAQVLADVGARLPPLTSGLLAAGRVAAAAWPSAIAVIGCAVLGTVWWCGKPEARARVHQALLRSPVIGPLRHALATARLARALGGILVAGLPALAALEIAGEAAGDEAVRKRLGRTRARVARGEPLTAALDAEGAVVPEALPLLAIGESSGQLGVMALRAAEVVEAQATRRLQTLVRLVEPVLVLFFGALLAVAAGALLQAVYGLRIGK